mmetsp:Transcript_60370/g.67500  ORF Transcript_60370/g.67500 Transcript_60370/m.67500 type:complete len:300 (+) Transcript_60370:86-985(+)
MPKVRNNAKALSRVVRRKIASEQVLPSSATRMASRSPTASTPPSTTTTPIDNTDKNTTHIDKPNSNVDNNNNNKKKKNIEREKQIQHSTSKIQSAEKTGTNDNDDGTTPVAPVLSRGQRKRLAKRETFLKKEKMILASLVLRKQDEQKKRIDGLDAIKEALMNTTTTTSNNNDQGENNRSGNTTTTTKSSSSSADLSQELLENIHHVSSNKAKRKLVGKEVENMGLILQHPAYQQDPFDTLQEHLLNTFAKDRKVQEKLSTKRFKEEKQKKESKLQRKKDNFDVKKKTQKKKYKPRRNK